MLNMWNLRDGDAAHDNDDDGGDDDGDEEGEGGDEHVPVLCRSAVNSLAICACFRFYKNE